MTNFTDTVIFHIFPLLVAIIFHEISHGVVAYALGDDTAKKAGRFKLHTHFDLWGSFLIPLGLYLMHAPFLIGYAKPVPVDPRKFKDPILDMALVAIAGPMYNFIVGIVCGLLLPHATREFTFHLLVSFTTINLALFFFNLIPIPPLDGSRILAAVLPVKFLPTYYRFEPFGLLIIIVLESLSSSLSEIAGHNLGLFYNFVELPVRTLLKMLIN